MLVSGLITTHETLFNCVEHIYMEDSTVLFRKKGFFCCWFCGKYLNGMWLGHNVSIDGNYFNLTLMSSLVRFIKHYFLGFPFEAPPEIWNAKYNFLVDLFSLTHTRTRTHEFTRLKHTLYLRESSKWSDLLSNFSLSLSLSLSQFGLVR